MQEKNHFALYATLVLMLSSCGVLTHTRYGNGFKLNIGGGHLDRSVKTVADAKRLKQSAYKSERDTFRQEALQLSKPVLLPDTLYGSNGIAPKLRKTASIKTYIKTFALLKEKRRNISVKKGPQTPVPAKKQSAMDPNILIGALVFYSSIAMGILSQLQILFPPFFIVIAFMGLFTGLIFTLVGYFSIDTENDILEKWIAWSVFGILIGSLILGLLGIMIYLTLLSN